MGKLLNQHTTVPAAPGTYWGVVTSQMYMPHKHIESCNNGNIEQSTNSQSNEINIFLPAQLAVFLVNCCIFPRVMYDVLSLSTNIKGQ